MEKAMKLAAILLVFTVVLCIFCYNSDDYMAQINDTTTSASTEQYEEQTKKTDADVIGEVDGKKHLKSRSSDEGLLIFCP